MLFQEFFFLILQFILQFVNIMIKKKTKKKNITNAKLSEALKIQEPNPRFLKLIY